MSPRENNGTMLPSDEIRLLPYQKTQNHTATVSETSGTPPAPKAMWPSSFISPTRRCHNPSKSWATYRSRPWNMCLLVVLGTAFALGHHLFYLALDRGEAKNQSLMLRYGTILAFCAKASLGTAAAMAFQQRAWLVLRHKMARLETVDSIFTANSDIFSLLTWSSIKKAKIGTLIAIYCWITPLVVVLTSETLSVGAGVKLNYGMCPNVRTLNFSNEEWYDWRTPPRIDSHFLYSVSFWNTTAPKDDIDRDNSNEFDYWAGPSQHWNDMVAFRSALASEPLVRKESGPELCSEGWNCSYVLSFTAPGYKCKNLASGINSPVQNLGDAKPPFNTSILAPLGPFIYFANNTFGDYEAPQMKDYGLGGRPKQKPPYPKNLGAFRTEPIMWIGYCTVDDYSKPQPPIPMEGDWFKAYTPVIFACEHYEVNYTVQFDWVGGKQSHTVREREFLRKVVNTTVNLQKKDPDKELADRTAAEPESNYVRPTDVENYRLTASYHSLGYLLRSILNGETTTPNSNVNSKRPVMPLVDRLNYLAPENLTQTITEMYENMIISLLSDPSFVVVSWASTGEPTGIATSDPSSKGYPCRKTRNTNLFEYNKAQLLTVYAVSIALATAAVVVGTLAYWEEGKMRDMKPSSIIEASRASDLHALDNKSEVKIGYGLVQDEAGRSFRSFGVGGNLTQSERPRDP